jgi:hypothetical protein
VRGDRKLIEGGIVWYWPLIHYLELIDRGVTSITISNKCKDVGDQRFVVPVSNTRSMAIEFRIKDALKFVSLTKDCKKCVEFHAFNGIFTLELDKYQQRLSDNLSRFGVELLTIHVVASSRCIALLSLSGDFQNED